MRQAGLLFLAAMVVIPRPAWPQGVPLGSEFRVNTYTTHNQGPPSIASDSSGNFIIVWPSYAQDGSAYGIFGQRYASSGVSLGAEFRVNTHTTDGQSDSSVAADAAGNFVVVWDSDLQDGSGIGIVGQRYASSGVPLGTEFQVNTWTTGYQAHPSVAADAAGNFVVVWWSNPQDGAGTGIFGHRYASSGAPLGPEFRVNTYTTGFQSGPSVASDPAGNFVVVWQSDLEDGSDYGIFGQRYASSGAPLGPEFRVNTYTTQRQDRSSVAVDASGDFVVVWNSYAQDGSYSGAFGQRYASGGSPLGLEFRVNTHTTGNQVVSSVASDAAGNFVVVWSGNFLFPTDQEWAAFGQRYDSSGAPLGSDFRANTYTTGNQSSPLVASGSSGSFVIAWTSFDQDGWYSGVFGQRYSGADTLSFALPASSVAEGGGNAAVQVVLTTSDGQPSMGASTVDFATADGTATAGADYSAGSGTLSFPPGTPNGASQAIQVAILDDPLAEPDETFTVGLANPTGAILGSITSHAVTIDDDDAPPSLSIGDSAAREGSNGTTALAGFPVSLSGPSGLAVSVDFGSSDGTATAGTDYQPVSGTLLFAPGDTSAQVIVPVLGDDLREADESYTIDLGNPVNATIADGQGLGTILNDDSWPELTQGQVIRADLQVQPGPSPDADVYSVSQKPYSSYEVLVDGTSGELGPSGPALERIASDGVTVLQSSSPAASGASRTLRWQNTVNATIDGEHIRVRAPACGTACDAAAVYRIRLSDTTASVARFNDSATQFTVLFLQNQSADDVIGTIRFWSPEGLLLASEPLSLASHGMQVVNTGSVSGVSGQSGSITIAHDGRHGALAGKAVALEPATGFTFETRLTLRPR